MYDIFLARKLRNRVKLGRIIVHGEMCHHCGGEKKNFEGRCVHCGAYSFEEVLVRDRMCVAVLK